MFAISTDRLRFLASTAADYAARWTTPAPRVERAHGHRMGYLRTPPRGRSALGVVITIDGSDRDFRGLHAAFVRARRDLPFDLITPFVVSNGPQPTRSDYPYSAREFASAVADPLSFDLAGLEAIMRDVRQNAVDVPVYLTGFSAGGHLAWLLVFEHADRLAGAAMASTNFAMRGLRSPVPATERSTLPIRGFFGDADSRALALLDQWEAARVLIERQGQHDIERLVIRGAGHAPFPRPVMEYFASLQLTRSGSRSHG